MGGADIRHRARPAGAHGEPQLALQDFEHPADARLPERAEPPEKRPSDADGPGAKREGLEHVGAAAEPAVDKDREGWEPTGVRGALRINRVLPERALLAGRV